MINSSAKYQNYIREAIYLNKINKIKIAVIGAGSTYTPELVEGIIDRWDSLGVGEIVFMDKRNGDIVYGQYGKL